MRIARMALPILLVLGVVGAVGWWAMRPEAVPAPVADPEGDAVQAHRPAIPLSLPVYRPSPQGLPPIGAPLRHIHAELAAAADRGNATAACRLAFLAMDCWTHRPDRDPEHMSRLADARYAENGSELLTLMARRLNQAPPALKDYVQGQIDSIALAQATEAETIRERARQCEGAPPLTTGDVVRRLRQAALAGQSDALVAYSSGAWITLIIGRDAARTPTEAAVPLDMLRDPSFLVWRRDAASLHQAGLDAGVLQSIELEAIPNRMSALDSLVERDPIQNAAAVRALFALVSHSEPPSTGSLGLGPADAAEADRRSDRWVAAARRRGATATPERLQQNAMTSEGRRPACE